MLPVRTNFYALTASALILFGCSSSPKQNQYPAGADAQQEITLFDQQMASAKGNQADILSPAHYSDAQEHLTKAKKEWGKNHDSKETFEELSSAKTSLNQATDVSNTATREIPEVVQARKDALNAEAPVRFSNELAKADSHLKEYTQDLEKGKMSISAEERNKLSHEFIAVELLAIKSKYLASDRQKIDSAKKMNAAKLAPQTLSDAEANFKAAETTIETDRHNDVVIVPAVQKANDSSDKVVEVTQYAKAGATEAVALELYRKNHLIAKQNGMIQKEAATNASLDANNQALNAQNTQLSSQNQTLANGANFNQVLKDAQGMFTADEAEVYRMGDRILVRLKEIQFPTGKATLPERSTATLQKVEKVMTLVGADKVVVEGHTDDVGGKVSNQKLSEKRAQTVANYLVKDGAIAENSIETEGYGYDKPLTTNKTKEGRAQNRRVDVLISPRSPQ